MFAGFVHSLVTQNPTRTYDLMYESPFYFEKRQTQHGRELVSASPTFTSIYQTFYDCINPTNRKSLCPYKNLRTHYIDYRFTRGGKKVLHMPTSPQQIAEIKKLVSSGKIAKQIGAINDINTRIALGRYSADQILAISLGKPHTSVVVMDVYGIARMLREFNETTGRHNSQFKGTSENIIYYAGAQHIDNMRSFFTIYLGLVEAPIKVLWYPKTVAGCNSFIRLDVGNRGLNFV